MKDQMIASREKAYEAIAAVLLRKAVPGWSSLTAICPILSKNCGGVITTQSTPKGHSDLPIGMDVFELQEACLFLRDDLLRTTNQRIWGLTFTLRPDGKFDLQYDYNKPKGYEETDETIDVSLTDFVDKANRGALDN